MIERKFNPAVPTAFCRKEYKVVRFRERCYLYSAVTNRLYSLLSHSAEAIEQTGDMEKLRHLEAASSRAVPLHIPPVPDEESLRAEIVSSLEKKTQQIVLGVTEQCNLNCAYCIYSGSHRNFRMHSSRSMPWEVARKGIDYLFRHCSESGMPPGIAFYGGEPLLELPLIQRCVEYAERRSRNTARFIITTNGTLLTKPVRKFFVQHDVTLLISLDGPGSVHDRYRLDHNGNPTFGRIMKNLRALKQEAPDYFTSKVRFSAVLSPPVDYAALIDFFDKEGVSCMVSPMEFYGMSDEWKQRINHPDFMPIADSFERVCHDQEAIQSGKAWQYFCVGLLGPAFRRIQTRDNRPDHTYHRLGQCIPGVRKVFINPAGELYPCEKIEGGRDVCIGHIDTGIDIGAVTRLLMRFIDIVNDKCGNCWMRRMCSACLADVVQGGCFDTDKMYERCASRSEAQAEMVGFYASLLEDNPNALAFLPEIFPWE